MGVSMVFSALAPLQLVALGVLFYGLAGHARDFKWVLRCGVWFALLSVRIPSVVSVILFVYLGVLYVAGVAASAYWLRQAQALSGFAVGASWVAVEAVNVSVLPLFGTGQLFVRSWSAYPELIAFTSLTGMLGVTFLLVSCSAQLALLLKAGERSVRLRQAVCLGLVLLVWVGLREAGSLEQNTQGWTVAAVGGNPEDFTGSVQEDKIVAAAEAGAQLVVFPELALSIFNSEDFARTLAQLQSLAEVNSIHIVIGYYDAEHNRNRAVHVAPGVSPSVPYTKTHLVPMLEKYEPGVGELVLWDYPGGAAGIMICQDDNFTTLSRAYGREGVSPVAVPTFDWEGVERAHFDSSIHRAIESQYGIVRAAIGGISAVISPGGEVLASMNHVEEGAGMVVATLPHVEDGRAIYARYGNVPVLVVSVVVLLAGVWLRVRDTRSS